MVFNLVATISSTYWMMAISSALETLSLSYLALHSAHYSILAYFLAWEVTTHWVFSANLFSYKAREASLWFFWEVASFKAPLTLCLVASISALIVTNWAAASASAAISASKAAAMAV